MENLIYIARKGMPKFYGQSAIGHAFNILNDDDWHKLNESAKNIPDLWGSLCSDSIKRTRVETEKKYNIQIKPSHISCLRCGKDWDNISHTCPDLMIEKMQRGRVEAQERSEKISESLLKAIEKIGVVKCSTLFKMPKQTISRWIKRGSIPSKLCITIAEYVSGALPNESGTKRAQNHSGLYTPKTMSETCPCKSSFCVQIEQNVSYCHRRDNV